ncbi:cupin domain-containing protein [Streptomyces gardneri]|nr:cupin domain-containing protein [Streptomyces gardneri]
MTETTSSAAQARIFQAQRQDKPWGHESIFAVVDGKYVGKVLHVRSGHALSLQKHLQKEETIFVLSGKARVDYGRTETELTSEELGPDDVIHIPAGAVHRVTAITDVVMLEASTADHGWREDIVRFDDRYGRQGRTEP